MADPVKSTPPSADTVPAALRGAAIVNIVIDVGDFHGGTEAEKASHDAYIKKINQSVAALREEGIPTVFIAITNENQVHEKLDAETRKTLKLTELDIKLGDIVFEKRFMSGFPTLEDIRNSPELEKYIISQRSDHGGADYAKAFEKTDLTLKHLLHDAEHVTVMGAMTQYCVTDNACDAAWHGKRVTVFSDTTTAWSKETMEFYEKKARGEAVDPDTPKKIVQDNPAFQEEQIRATIAKKKSDPAKMGRKPEEAGALDTIGIGTVTDFLKKLPSIKSSLSGLPKRPAPPAESKFLPPKEEPPHPNSKIVKGQGAVEKHGGKALGIGTVALDIAENHWGRAIEDATLQLTLNPETYEAAAKLAAKVGPVSKLLGNFGKKIPFIGAGLTLGYVLYEVGANVYDGKYAKASAALAAGSAETLGNIVGFGAGDIVREVVRETVVQTAGEEYAPEKSGLRQLGERAYEVGAKTIAPPKPR
ncbi:MAG: isochorismatase family protein [Alphaproteobacteria bacterium]|nr:MAG: isochorismatase family protein [Alphaproteobacteria bacterium]